MSEAKRVSQHRMLFPEGTIGRLIYHSVALYQLPIRWSTSPGLCVCVCWLPLAGLPKAGELDLILQREENTYLHGQQLGETFYARKIAYSLSLRFD